MAGGLDGRHALVTGGGRGIGRAVATAMSAAGVRVTLLPTFQACKRSCGQEMGWPACRVTRNHQVAP